jgi:hypothetical protein
MSRIHLTLRSTVPMVTLLILSVLFGCGKEPESVKTTSAPSGTGKPDSTATGSSNSSTVTAADLNAIKKAGQPYKILLIVKTLNNPFFKPMVAAFKQSAGEVGVQGDVQAAPQETDVC